LRIDIGEKRISAFLISLADPARVLACVKHDGSADDKKTEDDDF
jgi:hypothetical protein